MTSPNSDARSRPTIVEDQLSAPFWAATAEGSLAIQRCVPCGQWQHPPQALCYRCGEERLTFQPVSGLATVYSWVVAHRSFPGAAGRPLPYVNVLAELVEQPGLLLVSDVDDDEAALLRVGAPMRVTFSEQPDGHVLPRFQLTSEAEPL